jgi:hypothetical protein
LRGADEQAHRLAATRRALKPTSAQAGLAELERGRAPLHRDVLADCRDNIFAQDGNEVGIARSATLVHQQNLQSMLSGFGRSLPAE